MPTYSFINETTGEKREEFFSVTKRAEFLKENPDFRQEIFAVPFGHAERLGRHQKNDAFTDVMKRIQKDHPNSTIDV